MRLLAVVSVVAMTAAGCADQDESITRASYETTIEAFSESVTPTACESWNTTPGLFITRVIGILGSTPVPETNQTFSQVVSVEEMRNDLAAEMREACGGRGED